MIALMVGVEFRAITSTVRQAIGQALAPTTGSVSGLDNVDVTKTFAVTTARFQVKHSTVNAEKDIAFNINDPNSTVVDECTVGIAKPLEGAGNGSSSGLGPLIPPCHQVCTDTCESYECSCTYGYVLKDDERTCEGIQGQCDALPCVRSQQSILLLLDINECEIAFYASDCDQQCINTQGSFTCGCDSGFELSTDRTSCHGMCSRVCYPSSVYSSACVYQMLTSANTAVRVISCAQTVLASTTVRVMMVSHRMMTGCIVLVRRFNSLFFGLYWISLNCLSTRC